MKLSKYDHEVLSQIDELLLSENESVRELIQQAMVLQVLSKDDDGDKLRDKVIGPFQKMMHALQNAEDRINNLEMQISRNQDRNNVTTGGYWSDNTSSAYPTLSGVSPVWQTGLGPTMTHGNTTTSLDKDYMDKLSQWVKTAPTKSVTATTATDPDAMALIDPDTGHTMYVK